MPRIERGHDPASLTVWWDSVTSLHFSEKGVEIVARNYQRDILTNVLEPLSQNRPLAFQQDSAPAHKVKTTKQWLENHVPEFISSEQFGRQSAQTLIHLSTNSGQFYKASSMQEVPTGAGRSCGQFSYGCCPYSNRCVA